ncbi:protein ABHD1-like [Clytia hemisphaerica]
MKFEYLESLITVSKQEGVISWAEITITLVCGFLLYYLTQVVHKPKLFCKPGLWCETLKEHLKELENDQWPLLWCFWPLWQAAFHTLLMKPQHFDFERKEIETEDGGSFTLDFYGFEEDNEDNETKPILLILPGATGHSGKVYVREFISIALNRKYRAIGLNFRGWGRGVRLKTEKVSCVGNLSEIKAAFKHITKEHPNAPIMVIASSIGAVTFTNYLARESNKINQNIRAVMLLGVPWDPMESKARLSEFWINLVVNKHMTQNMINHVKRNNAVVEDSVQTLGIDLEEVYQSQTVWDFDDRYLCPLYGYKDHMEYYKDVGIVSLPLEKITVPVLALCTEDDPLCRGKAIPLQKIMTNSLLAVVTTKFGGHLTWLEGIMPTYKRFPHRVFEQYVDIFFGETKSV